MFDIRWSDDGVIQMIGRLDAAQTEVLECFFETCEDTATVDCAELSYISSAGLGVMFVAQKRLLDHGKTLRLVNLNAHLREVFEIAAFDQVFEIE